MKIIKYQYMVDNLLYSAKVKWSETNEEIVKAEAVGAYVIEDNGEKEELTAEQRIKELEEALALLLEGATE